MIRVKLEETPPSTQHIYRHNGPRVYMTQEGRDCKEAYQWAIKSQYKGKPLADDISVVIELHFKDKRIRDIDNFHKIVLDSCTGILWEDDSQIMELTTRKFSKSKTPGVTLCIA